MATLDSIRSIIESRIFEPIGMEVTASSTFTSTDKWGDDYVVNTSTSTLTAVPYNMVIDTRLFTPVGDVSEGETDILFRYTASIKVGMTITIDGLVYDVFDIEEYPYEDGNIAILARCKQQFNS